jgi:hypothetical protein
MGDYAKGGKAFGFCDRTGFRYPIDDLVPQYDNRRPTGLLVGRDMVDIDHEQNRLDEVDANDPQTLVDPRPDLSLVESRGLWAWNPVGGGITEFGSRTVGLNMSLTAGIVAVEIV